jgi:hypothetical protein
MTPTSRSRCRRATKWPDSWWPWLEDRGATLTFRHGMTEDWHLNLDGVDDMSQDEAALIAAAAFEIRDEIRTVLLLRRAVPTMH